MLQINTTMNAEMNDSVELQTKLCSNCEKHIAAVNFTMHEMHCKRNMQLCRECREPVAKTELDEHMKEFHTLVPCRHCAKEVFRRELAETHTEHICPECKTRVGKCKLDDHMLVKHSNTECVDCHQSVKKVDLDHHRLTSCLKGKVNCKFCGMPCLRSEFAEHEEYCKNRTEHCTNCRRYVKIVDMQLHLETHCQYPVVEVPMQDYYDDDFRGPTSPANRVRGCPSDVNSKRWQLKQLAPVRLPLFTLTSQWSSGHAPDDDSSQFHHEAHHQYGSQSVNDENADDSVETDSASTSEDDEDVAPCQFCEKSFPVSSLQQHQKICKNRYRADASVTNDVGVDEHRGRSAKMLQTPNYGGVVQTGEARFGQVGGLQAMTYCEFCGKKCNEDEIGEHLQRCYEQLRNVVKELLASKDVDRKRDVGSSKGYRFPFAALSLEQREFLYRQLSSG